MSTPMRVEARIDGAERWHPLEGIEHVTLLEDGELEHADVAGWERRLTRATAARHG